MVTKPCASLNDLLVREVKRPRIDTYKMEQNVRPPTYVFKPHSGILTFGSSSPESFECFEPQWSKAREILGRAAFGDDC